MTDKTYQVIQLVKDPRSGKWGEAPYETVPTLADAKRTVRDCLQGCRWIIVEIRVVARSPEVTADA